jgi:hypothetical protein
MFERVVFNYKDLEVRVSDHANDEILFLLDHTIQGSEGGMRYSLQNVAPRIDAYKDNIRFVSLYKKNQLTATRRPISDIWQSSLPFSLSQTGENSESSH